MTEARTAGHRTLLGFDFGLGSIGLAIVQEMIGNPRPLKALKAHAGQPDWRALEQLIQQWQPELLVVGLPLNTDGSEGDMATRARKFAARLSGRFGLPCQLQDERYSSSVARSLLPSNRSKGAVDCQSAALILSSWLEQHSE